jgi:transposase
MNINFFKEFYPNYLNHTNTEIKNDKVIFYFDSLRAECECPECGNITNTFKNYYSRKIQDLPIIDKQLFLIIHLKKYICKNELCNKGIFVEPIDELVDKKSRKTKRLDELLTRLALTSSAEEASRISISKKISISGDTLLRIAKACKIKINVEGITAVGIDDFSLKKNINMEQLL